MTDEWFGKICKVKRSETQIFFSCLFSLPWSVDLCFFQSTASAGVIFVLGLFVGGCSLNQAPVPGLREQKKPDGGLLAQIYGKSSNTHPPTNPSLSQFPSLYKPVSAREWAYAYWGTQFKPAHPLHFALNLQGKFMVLLTSPTSMGWTMDVFSSDDAVSLIKPHSVTFIHKGMHLRDSQRSGI